MQNKSPLLSIVIPTKNRSEYCIQAVSSILRYPYENFEIIVQDNSDTNDLMHKIEEKFCDNRLRYSYTANPVSFVENFNNAIENTNGEYLCLIGDDDAVCEDLFTVVNWAKQNDVDSICPKVFVNYLWPGNSNDGRMVIPYFSNKIWRNYPIKNLQSLVNQGIVNYMDFNLPKLYHGIVKKECMNEIKKKIGQYFGGLTPDIYSSVALSCIVKKHIVIDRPITVAGACPKSATVDSTKGKHSGKLENAPHFRHRGEYQWDEIVPYFYSVQTIWAESAIQAMKDFGVQVDFSKLNKSAILATAILAAPNFHDFFIQKTLENSSVPKLMLLTTTYSKMIKEFIVGNFKRVYYRIPRKYILRQLRLNGVRNIQEAVDISEKELKRTNITQVLAKFVNQTRII